MQAGTDHDRMRRAGRFCRLVAAMLVGGVMRPWGAQGAEARLARLPLWGQIVAVSAVLGALFAASLVAAVFGWLGMAVFWMIVILIVR